MRTYDPALGRYLQADPLGQAAGINVFAYARNAPQSWVDPEGMHPKCSEINTRGCPEQTLNTSDPLKDGAPKRRWGEITTRDIFAIPTFGAFSGEIFWTGTIWFTLLTVDWTDWQTWYTVAFKKITCPPDSPCECPQIYWVDCETARWETPVDSGTHREIRDRWEASPTMHPTPPSDDGPLLPPPRGPRVPRRQPAGI
jgi:hypothetical protein